MISILRLVWGLVKNQGWRFLSVWSLLHEKCFYSLTLKVINGYELVMKVKTNRHIYKNEKYKKSSSSYYLWKSGNGAFLRINDFTMSFESHYYFTTSVKRGFEISYLLSVRWWHCVRTRQYLSLGDFDVCLFTHPFQTLNQTKYTKY